VLCQVTSDVATVLGEHKVDAIVCVAGGWAGGNCSSKGEHALFAFPDSFCMLYLFIVLFISLHLFMY